MNCGEFEARIHQVLDRRRSLTDDDALADHALDCSQCAAKLDGYVELFEQVGCWQPLPLDADFSRRTVQRAFPAPVAVQPNPRAARQRFSYQVLTLLACLLLIAVLPRLWSPPVPTNSSTVDTAITSTLPATALPPSVAASESVLPVVELRTLQQVPGTALGAEGRTNDGWLNLWVEWSGRLAAEPFEPLDTFTQGIKPIAASLTTALDSLRTTFPLGDLPTVPNATQDAATLEHRAADRLG
jgi:hypothetical protein